MVLVLVWWWWLCWWCDSVRGSGCSIDGSGDVEVMVMEVELVVLVV